MESLEYMLDKSVRQRLCRLSEDNKEGCSGFIYGSQHESKVHITAATYVTEGIKSGTFMDHFLKNRCVYPTGVDPVGVFICNSDINELTNIIPMSSFTKLPEELVCVYVESNTHLVSVYIYNRMSKGINKVEYLDSCENPYTNHSLLRLTTTLHINYKFSTKKVELEQNCMNAIQTVIKSLTMPDIYYTLTDGDVYLSSPQQQLVIGAEAADTIEKINAAIENKKTDGDMREKRRKSKDNSDKEQKIIYVEMLRKLTTDEKSNTAPFSPVLHCDKADDMIVSVDLPIDSVILVHNTELLDKLTALFFRSIVRQLHLSQELLTQCEGTDICTLRLSHYWPQDSYFPITLLNTKSSQDSNSEEYRRTYHTKLMLPLDKPYFRSANTYYFPKDTPASLQLINPHTAVTQTKQLYASDGAVHLVHGRYAYHHYMQDKFDDNKWGCAYRSLQTLVSWFRYQGYTSLAVPSHREIQQTLVDIGDKPTSFVGSRQWIGSTEVSFVLDKLLNVDSRILFVSSGADLANKGRELVQHFTTQGTPIMIGGGVLAHTILGVYYNEQTGDIKFLILDPHYTGTEDIKTIIDKGWCGWKGPDFWVTDAHYNMCMPQRPKVF